MQRNFQNFANNRINPIVNNSYVSLALQVLLIIYIMNLAPKLPLNVMKFLNNPLIVVAALFLIIYTSTKNATTAILLAVAVVVTMHTINKYKNMSSLLNTINNNVNNNASPEGFSNNGGMNMSGVTNHVLINENGQPEQVNSHGDYRVSDSGILSNQYYCDNNTFDKAYNNGCGAAWGKPFDNSYGHSDEYSDAVGSDDMNSPPYYGHIPNSATQAENACCSKDL